MGISAIDSTNSMSSGSNNLSTSRLEVLDYIPLVSTVSGIARSIFGFLQMGAGTIQSTVDLVAFCVHPYENFDKDDGSYMFNQGKSNMVRGSVAMFPILGNIFLYLYDHSRFAKSGETINWQRVM